MKKASVYNRFRLGSLLQISILLALVVVLGGCASVAPQETTVDKSDEETTPDVQVAEGLYNEGKYREALLKCIEITQRDPEAPGLVDIRNRSISALLDKRAERIDEKEEQSVKEMSLEAKEKGFVPATYGLERFESGDEKPFSEKDSPLYELLERKVSIHLEGADVSRFIETLSANDGINMIADKGLASNKSIDIEVDQVPLKEVLNFMSRNYGIDFYLGQNIIWVTKLQSKNTGPLETRIFKLKRGIQLHRTDWNAPKKGNKSDMAVLSGKATVLSDGTTYIEEIINKFVPKSEGAQLHVDLNTHTVIARNTPDNLKMIGEILSTLDDAPKQVLIEARFIEISQANLRELGLDWTLNSPYITSKEAVFQNGRWVEKPKTQVDKGAGVSYTPYSSDDTGTFPLGPQGAFGLSRPGNPPTAGQGLNLTYQGVLTEPMFQAVLHAIDISGEGKTLSVPRVTTVNNSPAKLRDGEDLLYYEEFKAQAFQMVDDNNKRYNVTALIPSGKPSMAELGITLVAVPSVGADNKTVSLLLSPTISSLERFVGYQEEATTNRVEDVQRVVVKLPVIQRREIQTKVVVESGETVVLGGLIRTVRQETWHKVPILGSLPLVGDLFKRLDVTEENRNLLIFVTATVINERGESVLPRQTRLRSPPSEGS